MLLGRGMPPNDQMVTSFIVFLGFLSRSALHGQGAHSVVTA
jgi:hypothetical protein